MSPETGGFLFQAQGEAETKSGRSAVRGIADMVGQSGKPYKQVELADGTKLRFFDVKATEGLTVGQEVTYSMRKNEKGFWNPTSISPVLSEAAAKAEQGEKAVPRPEELVGERGRERWAEKDRQMMSMNAMTNATSLVTSMLPYLETKPTKISQALELVFRAQAEMMAKHEAPKENGS